MAICANVADGAIGRTSLGGYIHPLVDRDHQPPTVQPVAHINPIAPIDRLGAVYTALLENLTLSEAHADNLVAERGLGDTETDRNLYASTPPARYAYEIAQWLGSDLGYDLLGVPGFHREGDLWRLASHPPGFFIPVRDPEGRIQALQIRTDSGEPKYIFFSSPNRPGGASTGSPLHFVRPNLIKSRKEVILTEGFLKADIIADILDVGVVAAAGVDYPSDTGARLLQYFPDLMKCWIAFDADADRKPGVARAKAALEASLRGAGLQFESLTWPSGKGLDDYLATFRKGEQNVSRTAV